jgi:hypothetical protein
MRGLEPYSARNRWGTKRLRPAERIDSAGVVLAAFVLWCVQAVPQRWLLTVDGVPLAELRVEVDGRHYRYEATHFLEEGPTRRRFDFTLDEAGRANGLVPEVLALARRPEPGCRTVLEEVEARAEELCVASGPATRVTGTLAGKPFTARYDASGALAVLELGAARWTATATPAWSLPPTASPFARGFALEGLVGPVTLEPPLKGAVRLASPPRGVATEGEVGRARCLVAAKRYVAAHPGAVLVLGLVVEDGRAFPHAWALDGNEAVEPSVVRGDPTLAAREYLALPASEAGRVYLELIDGTRRVTRVAPR